MRRRERNKIEDGEEEREEGGGPEPKWQLNASKQLGRRAELATPGNPSPIDTWAYTKVYRFVQRVAHLFGQNFRSCCKLKRVFHHLSSSLFSFVTFLVSLLLLFFLRRYTGTAFRKFRALLLFMFQTILVEYGASLRTGDNYI